MRKPDLPHGRDIPVIAKSAKLKYPKHAENEAQWKNSHLWMDAN